MRTDTVSRRRFLKHLGIAGAGIAGAGAMAYSAHDANAARIARAEQQNPTPRTSAEATKEAATREQRMAWWHEAKFGMFIHWGLYSVVGQHEWALEVEGIPIPQYELLAKHFQPKPNAAREWARL